MKNFLVFLFLIILFNSCFLLSDFKKRNFTYTEGSQSHDISFVVPRGYKKERTERDSLGNITRSYSYGDALFYIAYLKDTGIQIQPVSETQNVPHISLQTGALVYKGMDSADLFWREVRQKNFRVGYRFVPPVWESKFDSATNYAIVTPLK